MTEIDDTIKSRTNSTKKVFLKKAGELKDRLFQAGWDVYCSEVKETAIEYIVEYAENISQVFFNRIKCSENNLTSEPAKIKKQIRSYVDKTKTEVKETLVDIVNSSIIEKPDFTKKVLHLLDFTAEADEKLNRVYNKFDASLSEYTEAITTAKDAKKLAEKSFWWSTSISVTGILLSIVALFKK